MKTPLRKVLFGIQKKQDTQIGLNSYDQFSVLVFILMERNIHSKDNILRKFPLLTTSTRANFIKSQCIC